MAENSTAGLVDKVELARIFKVKVRTIATWIDDGCPVAHRGGGRGNPNLFDLAKVQDWRANVATGGPLDLTAERALLTREQRREAEIRVKKATRELIPIKEVGQLWSDMIGAARSKLLSIPTKAAPLVVSCGTLGEVQTVLDDLVREALEDVAGDGIPRDQLPGSVEATTETDSQPVGGPLPEAEQREQRGAGAVADK